jgi:hypothetical protein
MIPRTTGAAACVLLCLAAACTDRSAVPLEPAPPSAGATVDVVVTGRASLLDGAAPAGLRAILAGDARVAVPLAADGSFSVAGRVTGDSVDVIIDVAEGGTRTTFPALVTVSAHAPAPLRIVLVPNRYTVSGGTYDGTTIDVSMDLAFRPPCTTAGDTNCDGFYPATWFSGITLWQTAALPVPLAFDHGRSHQPITAADSAEFWNIIADMNATAGTPLFRPARAADIGAIASATPNGGVAVRVDTTLANFSAWANWWWTANGDMHAGVVRMRTAAHVRSRRLVTHELLHTQGFKHSCSWATVMDGYACFFQRSALSAPDIAYLQLARAVRDAQRAATAAHGLVAALQGERVVLRGLPRYAPAAPALPSVRGDTLHGDHAH